jgi:hypothetical protein
MRYRKPLSAAIAGFLWATPLVGSASAQSQTSMSPPYLSYAAKFVCSDTGDDLAVVNGEYRTTINIHNPQAHLPVTFLKKVVLAHEEGQSGCALVINPQEVLQPDAAEQVDCPVIHIAVFANPQKCFPPGTTNTVLEGFVVIQVPTERREFAVLRSPVLDVVGIYTAGPRIGGPNQLNGVKTENIVVYTPQEIVQ